MPIVDAAEMLRAVRRRKGWSQRELAERSGVSARTVAAIESGQREPGLAVLRQILTTAGLELSLDAPPPSVDEPGQRHLQRSLSRRLHLALGGGGVPHLSRPAGPAWRQLLHLAARGPVVLHGSLALAVWIPPEQPLTSGEVCFARSPQVVATATPDLRILDDCHGHAAAVVAVSVEAFVLGVDPPADLALDPAMSHERARLRAVARLLHMEAARDAASRRVRAHAEPRHRAERDQVFHTKRFGWRPMPDENDRRGWRLRDDASLAAWLARHGYPV